MENHKQEQTSNALKLSIATGLTLALIKFTTGLLTHSMAIMASALDSAMDVGVSTVNWIAAREAAKPPDEEHAYGHGKIESLAALFQSLFIAVTGIYIMVESFKRLFFGSFVKDAPVGIGVMIVCILITFFLVWRLRAVQKHNHSMILATEELHFTTDVLSNGGVIAALALTKWTGFVWWDLLISILVVSYVFRSSYYILRRAVDELLDRSLSPVSKEEIEKLILGHDPSIVGLHNFRSRQAGQQVFIDFHMEIRGEENFKKAHLMVESVIQKIRDKHPGADVTVHFDPEGEM
ncbi:MAG: cation transporter [Candidatus Omnitrophica bacterium]|nr:cation transporter [Candidatus Omnitrophota bacterium]